MSQQVNFFDTKIELLRVIGPQRALVLNTELHIFTYRDLLQHYPFRYEDRTQFHRIRELNDQLPAAQIKGRIKDYVITGEGAKKRLVVYFTDDTGMMELVWFQGISWFEKNLRREKDYVVYGKLLFSVGDSPLPIPKLNH